MESTHQVDIPAARPCRESKDPFQPHELIDEIRQESCNTEPEASIVDSSSHYGEGLPKIPRGTIRLEHSGRHI